MAEWLRRLTRNQFRSAGVGSNPTDREIFIQFLPAWVGGQNIIFIEWKCQMSWDEVNSANQLRVNPCVEAVSIVGSVVECSPATRAARVRFPDDAIVLFLFFAINYIWYGIGGHRPNLIFSTFPQQITRNITINCQ